MTTRDGRRAPRASLCGLGAFAMLASCGGGGEGGVDPASSPPSPLQALSDPIPESIATGDIRADAVRFVRAPRTKDAGALFGANDAHARIQYLKQAPDASGRLFFNDNRGILYVTDTGGADPAVYLDLREHSVGFSNVVYPNESGFMGFAFHPDFSDRALEGYGRLYVAFSAWPLGATADFLEEPLSVEESVVYEFSADDAAARAFRGTGRELLRVGQFRPNHNIGNVAFNPNAARGTPDFGALYVALGDGGGANDPRGHGQNKATPLGAILRIDPLGGVEGEAEYGIPSDNPFVDDDDAIPELWAYGLRHPQNFSWDSDGTMYVLDIGQDQIEEVNIGVAGANYGWPLREGTFATAFGVGNGRAGSVYARGADARPYAYPVAQYDHDEGFAIGSGFVYRGDDIPELVGRFVFSELVRGRVFYVETEDLEPGRPAVIREMDLLVDGAPDALVDVAGMPNPMARHAPHSRRADLRISVDADGEMYLLTKGDGWIRKLRPPAEE